MDIIFDDSYNIKEIEVDPTWISDLGSDYLEYRRKWDLASNQQQLYDFPLFLEVETSYSCNYRCPKCPRQAIHHAKKSGFLSNELLDKLFNEVKQYKMPSITFSHGGEPLMRKDIPKLIRQARDSYILDRMFHTNGSLLNRKLSTDLIEGGLTKINFSIDAVSPEVYAKVRAGGDYNKVISSIEEFLKVKKEAGKSYPRARVSFIVSEENKHEQKIFYDLWKDKVNVISFQQCYDFTQLSPLVDNESENYPIAKHTCSQLWQLLTITYEGDILVCERDYFHQHVLGNLRTHTIYECWHSKMIDKFRKLHLENRWHEIPLCRKCVNSVDRGISLEV